MPWSQNKIPQFQGMVGNSIKYKRSYENLLYVIQENFTEEDRIKLNLITFKGIQS